MDIDTILIAKQDVFDPVDPTLRYVTKGKKYPVLWTKDDEIQVKSDVGKAWFDMDSIEERYWGRFFDEKKPKIMVRIHINKSRAKQPYSVSYYSRKKIGNGKFELLARTENLPTRANCITNIKSMSSIFGGVQVQVYDNTGLETKEITVS